MPEKMNWFLLIFKSADRTHLLALCSEGTHKVPAMEPGGIPFSKLWVSEAVIDYSALFTFIIVYYLMDYNDGDVINKAQQMNI